MQKLKSDIVIDRIINFLAKRQGEFYHPKDVQFMLSDISFTQVKRVLKEQSRKGLIICKLSDEDKRKLVYGLNK